MERLTIASAALGIDMEERESGWFSRLCTSGPEYDWAGPFDSQYAAHATAVRKLLFFA